MGKCGVYGSGCRITGVRTATVYIALVDSSKIESGALLATFDVFTGTPNLKPGNGERALT